MSRKPASRISWKTFGIFKPLYSPRLKRAVHRDGFTALLTLMFENDAHDECLIFHKKRLAITKASA